MSYEKSLTAYLNFSELLADLLSLMNPSPRQSKTPLPESRVALLGSQLDTHPLNRCLVARK